MLYFAPSCCNDVVSCVNNISMLSTDKWQPLEAYLKHQLEKSNEEDAQQGCILNSAP